MHAIIAEAPEVLAWREVADLQPAPGEVLIRVAAAGAAGATAPTTIAVVGAPGESGEIADFVVLHTFFSDEATTSSVEAVRRGLEDRLVGKSLTEVRVREPRLRRGTLYTFADEIGATKMALGHHRDDILETFFLNMFYGGTLKAMPPKLLADDGRNVVIRPLAYCSEKDIEAYSQLKEFPIIPCNLCGSQENLQRQVVKEMLQEWERKSPGRTEIMFRALQNVVPSQLADRNLFDFKSLRIDDSATPRFVDVMSL